MRRLAFKQNKGNIKKMIIPMESIKTPKRIIKKQLKNVNKVIFSSLSFLFLSDRSQQSVSITSI